MQNDNFNAAIDRMTAASKQNGLPEKFKKPSNSRPDKPRNSQNRNNGRNGNRNGYGNAKTGHRQFNRPSSRPQITQSTQIPAKNQEIFLSVIIPAYNEEKRLPKTLEILDAYLRKQPYNYEIIVANDGSKDNTGRAVETLIGKVAKLKLLDNHVNHGKGYVVRQGLLAARGRIRLFTDADNSTPIEEVEKLMPFFKEGYDVVIGSRHAAGAKLEPAQPPIRQFLGWGWRMLTNIVAGTWAIKDTQCGFKALSAKAAN